MEGVNMQQDQEQRHMKQVVTENKPPPNQKCPRCESTNTKFGYFNNYKTDQPRYFCKICRRYWTRGGKLRNIPFGGGKRFMKRARDSSSSYTWELPQVRFTSPPPPLTVVGNFNKLPIMNMPFTRPLISMSGGTEVNVTPMSSFNHPPQASFRQSPMINFENNGLANLAILQGFNNVSSPYILDQQQQSFPPMQPNDQSYQTENYDLGLLAQTQPNTLIDSLSEANINNNDNTNSINSTALWDYDIPINETEEFSSSFDQFLGCGPPA